MAVFGVGPLLSNFEAVLFDLGHDGEPTGRRPRGVQPSLLGVGISADD